MSDSVAAGSDQSIRERALDPAGSFIVQAPAGSGKTELLIQRYLALLGRVREPEEIVAITFTVKAAGEMRERILDALRRAADGEAPGDAVEGRRLALARRAIDNDRRFEWRIINHPARLQIQTIDALCLSLARQLPFLSGFAAPSGILEDPAPAYRRAATETIKLLDGRNPDWDEALEIFLVHVDNDAERAVSMIADMLASRDQWLRHIGGERAAPEALAATWHGIVEDHLRRTSAWFPEELKAEAAACADAAAAHLAPDDAPGASAWLRGAGFPEARAPELARWRFLCDLLLTAAGRWRVKVTATQGFPPRSDAKRRMQALLSALPADGPLAAAVHAARSLPEPGLDDEQARVLNAMTTVLRLAVAQLRLVFEETGRVDFVEITERAIAALGGLEEPSELALKLDYRIAHLLVDEFQDTSIAQYHLLRLLTQGWAPEDGRTLFLVGDPMQSIYRFREAEVAVFLMVREAGIGTVPLEPLVLESNFRSRPALVEWVNRTFRDVFPGEPDPQLGAVTYSASTPARTETHTGDGVHVHPFVDCPPDRQASRLAALIEEALARSDDVAVLVRARPHLRALLPALETRGVPYSGMDITALIDQPVVRDLHSLTRALLHPGDRLAWLAILRAPWCGLMLADLLAVAGPRRRIVWSALRDPAVRECLSDDGLARLDRFHVAMAEAMAQRGRLGLRQWVNRAWVTLGGPALAGEAGHRHADAYLALLERHQSGMNLVDEPAFDQALEKHWAHEEPRPGAVQLMTIHRAKGLEFDEVFLPSLERPEAVDDKRLLLWEELSGDGGLLLSVLSARGRPEDSHYRFLRDLQSRKAANESDRLLYVACTRARRRLHLAASLATRDGEVAAPRRDSPLGRIWTGVETAFSGPVQDAVNAGGSPPAPDAVPALRRMPRGWTAPDLPAPPVSMTPAPVVDRQVEFSWVGETARLVGILVHELLQRIALEGLEEWTGERIARMQPAWRSYLGHIGVPSRELDAASERTADAIRHLLGDQRACWLLHPDHRQARSEYEISVVEAGRVRRLRVDRTFIDEQGTRWIVDYKTSAHEGGAREAFLDEEVRRYRPQMETYAAAFRGMGADEIRLGLYFPLLAGWREWRFEETGEDGGGSAL